MAEVKAQYSAILLGATGNVGGRIAQLLIESPLCRKVVLVTRRRTKAFADPKVYKVVVNTDRLEEEVAPHAQGVDVALAAFGVGKGSAKMPEEELRKIEIAFPQAFCRAARAGGARVCGLMTAAGADPKARMKYAKIIGEKEKAVESFKFDFLGVYRPAVILGNSNTPGVLGYAMPLLHWAMPSKYHSIHKNDLARAMVAQSERAFLAIAQGSLVVLSSGVSALVAHEFADLRPRTKISWCRNRKREILFLRGSHDGESYAGAVGSSSRQAPASQS
jgi:uncharacterized protein YbjT (DUF2867 family)